MGKQLCVGILAHVDAGKTTLCEAHGDTLLDSHDLERRRGITIFSKRPAWTSLW